jgi:hypothetical protein
MLCLACGCYLCDITSHLYNYIPYVGILFHINTCLLNRVCVCVNVTFGCVWVVDNLPRITIVKQSINWLCGAPLLNFLLNEIYGINFRGNNVFLLRTKSHHDCHLYWTLFFFGKIYDINFTYNHGFFYIHKEVIVIFKNQLELVEIYIT